MIDLQCHSHFPNFLNLSPSSSSSSPQIKPQISLIFGARLSSGSKQFHKTRHQTTLRRSGFRDGVEPGQEKAFFDENGAVEDMDSYLNYLSLEYDSVWDTKPSCSKKHLVIDSYAALGDRLCQPWTIALTGIGIITGIFRYDYRTKKEGDKWFGRHLWYGNRPMNLEGKFEAKG
ncbi:hypothetical protein DH2020_046207 [Rehmannia glutinosa]|uniref:Uncharacterized protein n=1 Tax=Rehmannia glutinosa TaxID=99300 RepID=A0ABR0UCA0_REHGL